MGKRKDYGGVYLAKAQETAQRNLVRVGLHGFSGPIYADGVT